jgi:nucleoside-diphosphate-sugar epimerase
MRVLILGGSGLISSEITKQLLAKPGVEVVHFNRGKRDVSWDQRVETIRGDRYDHASFVSRMQEAQQTRPFDAVLEMIGYQLADIEDLSAAFAGRIGQLIFCSTVDVYSKPPARYPVSESASQSTPAPWNYAQNKAACEAALQSAQDRGDFPVTILRPAHTYSDRGTLLHSLGGSTTYLDRLRRGLPIIVHGDGQSLWTSCHATDAARAFVNALGCVPAYGKGYTVTTDEWMTWNDIHRTVAQAIGAPDPSLVHIPTQLLARLTERAFISLVNFKYNNIFDTAAARTDLHFRQTIPFAEGARRVYDHLEGYSGIETSADDSIDDRIISAWEKHTEDLCGMFLPA